MVSSTTITDGADDTRRNRMGRWSDRDWCRRLGP
jgi:hypothetical protein